MIQRWNQLWGIALGMLLMLVGIPSAAQQTNEWFAVYYNNQDLQGSPAVTRFEATPSDNWGLGSPSPNVNPNNWSARWTRTTYLDGGEYRLQVRPDDGVRVYFDGNLIIDEWHGYYAETYEADISVTAGTHTIIVEYFDAVQEAFLNYGFSRIDTREPIFPGTTQALVATDFLNLRNQPTDTAAILGVLQRGEQYPVLDRTPDGNWVQINVNTTIGWVDAEFVDVINADTPPDAVVEPTVTVTTGLLNVRDAPDPVEGEIVTQILRGGTYPALRQNSLNGWIQIRVDGQVGWVNENYVRVDNPDLLPEVAYDVRAVVTAGRLNVRRQPTVNADVLLKINRGETYPILGRNDAGTWLQINVNGTIGWVSADYIQLNRDIALPVTVGVEPDIPADDEVVVTATPYPVNLRAGPGTRFDDIGNVERGEQATVIGRNFNSTWWQVNYNGVVGWVAAEYTRLERGVNPESIPVTS